MHMKGRLLCKRDSENISFNYVEISFEAMFSVYNFTKMIALI